MYFKHHIYVIVCDTKNKYKKKSIMQIIQEDSALSLTICGSVGDTLIGTLHQVEKQFLVTEI